MWWCGRDHNIPSHQHTSACLSISLFSSLPILLLFLLSFLLARLPTLPHANKHPPHKRHQILLPANTHLRNLAVGLCVVVSLHGILVAVHHPRPFGVSAGVAYFLAFWYAALNLYCGNIVRWVYFLLVGELCLQVILLRRHIRNMVYHGAEYVDIAFCVTYLLELCILACLLASRRKLQRTTTPILTAATTPLHVSSERSPLLAAAKSNNIRSPNAHVSIRSATPPPPRPLSVHSGVGGIGGIGGVGVGVGVGVVSEVPEESACLLSKLTYWWIWPLLNKGYKTGVVETKDLPRLSAQDQPQQIADRFEFAWQKHVEYCKQHNKTPSLLWVLHGLEWQTFYLTGVLLLVSSMAAYAVPLLLNELLKFLADKDDDESSTHGYLLAVAMTFCGVMQSLTEHQFWIVGVRCGLHTQEALVAAVFRKVFRMANHSRAKYSEGTILNHMSVDACRVNDSALVPSFHWGTWSSLATIAVSLYFLHDLLGTAAFVGTSFLGITWPIAIFASKHIKRQAAVVQGRRDARATCTSQVLSLHRVIKAFVWEDWAAGRVSEQRASELSAQRKKQLLGASNSFFVVSTQVLAPVITFVFYTQAQGHKLDAATAFSSLAWFNIIQRPLGLLPWAISNVMDTQVSLERLSKFLLSEEEISHQLDQGQVAPGLRIDIRGADFSWHADPNRTLRSPGLAPSRSRVGAGDKEQESQLFAAPLLATPAPPPSDLATSSEPRFSETTLHNINLQVKSGQFVMIIGPVGCGKSSLLAAITGSIRKSSGSIGTKGSISFASQQPWIQNMTIRQNILFGKSFDANFYHNVLHRCALEQDLAMFDQGDTTEIGEDGVNLSGGQRQRISLARAVYADADIVVLDDVLSAVDSHVGQHIFDKCLSGILGKKTRIMATHQTHFLRRPEVSMIVVMRANGSVAAVGDYSTLKKSLDPEVVACLGVQGSVESLSGDDTVDDPSAAAATETEDTSNQIDDIQSDAQSSCVDNERRAVGSVDMRLLIRYVALYGSWPYLCLLSACFLLQPVLRVLSTFWLSIWIKHADKDSNSDSGHVPAESDLVFYCVLTIGLCGTQFARMALLVLGALSASSKMHLRMLMRVIRAPCWFYDRELTGRIMNRFVKDVSSIDETIPSVLADLTYQTLVFLSVLITICFVIPPVLGFIAALSVPYVWISLRYLWPARDLRRLESTSRSPMFSHFAESIRGVDTIRAFAAQARFHAHNIKLIHHNVRCSWLNWVANQWVTVWLELIGYAIILACSCMSVWFHSTNKLSASLVGVALTYVVQIPTLLGWCLKQYTRIEVEFVAVERVIEYFGLEQEPDNGTAQVPQITWPNQGAISFNDLTFRYQDDLPPVMENFNLAIPPGAKVAIVGRTGSGKSSLVLSLLRFYKSVGSITIDNVDTLSLTLQAARGAVCYIPQSSSLFGSTVREVVVGPQVSISDEQLWKVLNTVGVAGRVQRMRGGLNASVGDAGNNLSAGERQLLCLARALVQPRAVMICDEATSSVDPETDELVTSTLLKMQSTVLFICHRLHRIKEFDSVLVMAKGKVKEWDNPNKLLEDPSSELSAMVAKEKRGKHSGA